MLGKKEHNLELCRALSRFYERVHSLGLGQYSDYLYGLAKILGVKKKRVYNYYYNLSKMEKERRTKALSLHYYGLRRQGLLPKLEASGGTYCLCKYFYFQYRDGHCYFCHLTKLKAQSKKDWQRRQLATERRNRMERRKEKRKAKHLEAKVSSSKK